jgi:hypothetical protein
VVPLVIAAILRTGLLCRKSKGKLKVVWLHAAGKTEWATLHTVQRHGGRVEEVVVVEVSVPRRWLRRSRKGLWYSVNNVAAERIRHVLAFGEVAEALAG